MTRAGKVIFALGLAVCAFGVGGLLAASDETRPLNWALYVGGALFAHDALLAPLVIVGSFVAVVVLPTWLTPTVQTTLFVSACAVLVAAPVLTGAGRLEDNPSLLPHDYWRNLVLVVGAIWVGGALIAVRRYAKVRA